MHVQSHCSFARVLSRCADGMQGLLRPRALMRLQALRRQANHEGLPLVVLPFYELVAAGSLPLNVPPVP